VGGWFKAWVLGGFFAALAAVIISSAATWVASPSSVLSPADDLRVCEQSRDWYADHWQAEVEAAGWIIDPSRACACEVLW
jgi:hypothetical protein